MNLIGRTALITGAGQGIGQACAEVFAERGANLVLMDKNKRTLPKVADQITEKGGHVKAILIDLTHHRKLHKIIDVVKSQAHIDILVNNAGFDRPGTTMKIGKEQFNAVLGIHVGVPFFLIKSFIQEMRAARWGRIINISSIYGVQGAKGEAAYSTAKAAVIGLTKTAAREAGKDGVTVNAIVPGLIKTPPMIRLPDIKPVTRRMAINSQIGMVANTIRLQPSSTTTVVAT